MSTLQEEPLPPQAEPEALPSDGSVLQCPSNAVVKETKPKATESTKPSKIPGMRNPKRNIYSARAALQAKSPTTPHNAPKKQSASGIPLPVKSGTSLKTKQPGTYIRSHSQHLGGTPAASKNTLELQFMSNKKRLNQLISDLEEKQRPVMELHKSLQRTKRQLDEMGKKVDLEPLKTVTMKNDEKKESGAGAGEAPINEATMKLKTSVEGMMESFTQMCKNCLARQNDLVKILESVSKEEMELGDVTAEMENLKQERDLLESSLDTTRNENEKKISELVTNFRSVIKTVAIGEEATARIAELEEKVKQQQRHMAEAESDAHMHARKLEEKKAAAEKTAAELQDKVAKLEEEVKREKKIAIENVTKARSFRTKLSEAEGKNKDFDDKHTEAISKLKQVQEQMRKKEIQWLKEKEEMKKSEDQLKLKFAENQTQLDARLRIAESDKAIKQSELEQELKMVTEQLEAKDAITEALEKQIEELREDKSSDVQLITDLEKQVEKLNARIDDMALAEASQKNQIQQPQQKPAAVENRSKQQEQHVGLVLECQNKIKDMQKTITDRNDQISKMQCSLKNQAQLAVALKMERDNAVHYSQKLRSILREARDDIDLKNKSIYNVHERLVLKENECQRLNADIKELKLNSGYLNESHHDNSRCQICMSAFRNRRDDCPACSEISSSDNNSKVGKNKDQQLQQQQHPNLISESLIGMSVKKVDNIRARLDNLKKLKLPVPQRKKISTKHLSYTWSNQSTCCPNKTTSNNNMHKQLELRGKLYQVLQKHADESCEDFIKLLKLTASSTTSSRKISEVSIDELKPSKRTRRIDKSVKNEHQFIKTEITKSYSTLTHYRSKPFDRICTAENILLD